MEKPPQSSRKLPREHAFLDLSDYGRPVALWIVAFLLHRPIGVLSVTSTFLAAGLIAAALIALGSYPAWIAAAILLQVKNILDAVDGSLARARQTPSRLGRFYDSFCDFVVGLVVFAALGHRLAVEIGWPAVPVTAAAFLSALLHCTLYSYHTVAHRLAVGGDRTSRLDEVAAGAGGNDWRLRFLYRAYLAMYAWQDRLVARLDKKAPPGPRPRGFLTAVSLLGLGTQILELDLFLLAGWPTGYLWFILLPANLLAAGIVAMRRRGGCARDPG